MCSSLVGISSILFLLFVVTSVLMLFTSVITSLTLTFLIIAWVILIKSKPTHVYVFVV